MKIYNELDEEIQESDIDLELGFVTSDKRFVKHHEAVEEQEEVKHFECQIFYFEDDTQLDVSELGNDDPHVKVLDDTNGIFDYVDQGEGKTFRGLDLKEITDKEKVEAKEAYDEYEDILRYKLFSEEELAQHAAQKAQQEMDDMRRAQIENILQMLVESYSINMLDEDLYTASMYMPTWAIGKKYKIKDVVQYEGEGTLYRCLQDHTATTEHTPDIATSLWKKIEKPVDNNETIFPWGQPLGSTDAYMKGDKVTFNDKVWESFIDYNVWSPLVYGWTEVKDSSTESYPEFKPPTGAHDAYKKGDRVTFENKVYESLIDANVYFPKDNPDFWKEIQE